MAVGIKGNGEQFPVAGLDAGRIAPAAVEDLVHYTLHGVKFPFVVTAITVYRQPEIGEGLRLDYRYGKEIRLLGFGHTGVVIGGEIVRDRFVILH